MRLHRIKGIKNNLPAFCCSKIPKVAYVEEQSGQAFQGNHMTVRSALAHSRPPDNDPKIKLEDTTEDRSTSSFHDYAKFPGMVDTSSCTSSLNPETMALKNKQQRKQLSTVMPIIIIPEHSLVYDLGVCTSTSPGSSLMYEVDPMETNKAILSPCTSESLHSPMSLSSSFKRDAFDQPMQMEEESINLSDCDAMTLWGQDGPAIQEYLTDIINGADGSTIKDIGDELVALTTSNYVKTEEQLDNCCGLNQDLKSDSLEMGLKDKESQGPTLAELNDRESVLDILRPAIASNDSVISTQPPCGGTLSLTDSSSSNAGMSSWGSSYTSSNNTCVSVLPCPSGQSVVSGSNTRLTASSRPRPSPAINDLQVTNLGETKAKVALFTTQSFEQMPMQLSSTSKSSTAEAPEAGGSLQQLLGGIKPSATGDAAELEEECTATRIQPLKIKRKLMTSISPDHGKTPGNGTNSMERKWEEIRSYIDSNIKMEEEQLKRQAAERAAASTPLKKIKIEQQDSMESDTVDVYGMTDRDAMDSDFDQSEDDFSDVESDASYGSFVEDLLHGNKKEKFFWQYNTQSKGPKGKRLCKSMQERDPHSLADFEDPVFQPDVNDARYKHNGKARKGDGNDITPSPWKLFQIGNELQKLNKKINGISALERPTKTKDGVKSKSRKEKNKFASRACRLKKKAQHEANKLKLFGLEQEHHQLIEVLKTIKQNIFSQVKDRTIVPCDTTFASMLETEIKENLTVMIAGNTADYVNTILQKVAEGDRKGGICIHRN